LRYSLNVLTPMNIPAEVQGGKEFRGRVTWPARDIYLVTMEDASDIVNFGSVLEHIYRHYDDVTWEEEK